VFQEGGVPKIGEDVSGGGIVLKSANAKLVTMTAGVYMRTGSSDGEIRAGEIVLDADKGNKEIRTICSHFERRAKFGMTDVFGITQVTAINSWSGKQALLDTTINTTGGLIVAGANVTIRGSLSVVEGNIIGEREDGKVDTFSDIGRDRAKTAADQIVAAVASTTDLAQTWYDRDWNEKFYVDDKIGSKTTQKSVGFSFRDEDQYGTNDFKMVEAEWQQLARLSGESVDTWTEPVVQYQGYELMPYPGTKKWRDEQLYYTVDTVLFDPTLGYDKDRGELYENAELQAPTPKAADGTYKIIG
jgi:hypothetical protein